jgi:hypothetical protein
MILYFDNYITDQPLHQGWNKVRNIERQVRNGCQTYKTHTRLDIAKYTLASYAHLEWTNVLIKYELQDSSKIEEFDHFILELFPKAIILHNRSDSQSEYQKSIELLKSLGDEWIFYSPNSDHVFIDVDKNSFDHLIKKANSLKEINNNYISIVYSHFPEVNCASKKEHIIKRLYRPDTKIIEEDEYSISQNYPKGNLDSIQILHIDLLQNWFFNNDCGNNKIIRSESLAPFIEPPQQIVITPKHEICRHYDGYMHTIYGGRIIYLSPEKVPPLFIPPGFFENNIKVSYGYDEYREGWVNINPLKNNYSFNDRLTGTDIMCTIEELPFFWQERISQVNINPNADLNHMSKISSEKKELLSNPWKYIPKLRVQIFLYFRWYRRILAILRNLLLVVKKSNKSY